MRIWTEINKRLDLRRFGKDAYSSGGNKEAEELFNALFGQMPYVFIVGKGPVALSEAVTLEGLESFGGEVLYKKKEPFPARGLEVNYVDASDAWTIGFFENDGILIELPEDEMSEGPWYTFVPADVDLSKFSAPVVDGDPVPLTGMELPIQSKLRTFNMEAGLQEYTLTTEDTAFYKCIAQENGTQTKYTIEKVEGVWMWKAETQII